MSCFVELDTCFDKQTLLLRAVGYGIVRGVFMNDAAVKKQKAIMFDLDGTLLDTLEDLANSMNAVLHQQSDPVHDLSFYRTAVGDGVRMLAVRSLPPEKRTDEHLIVHAVRAMREEYATRWHENTGPYEGIKDVLKELERARIPMTILSNKPHSFTVEMVEHYFGEIPFAEIHGAREGGPVKPDPAQALRMAENLAVAAEDWAYVGDTNTDMKTAVAAGMFPVGVSWGFRTAEELVAHGASVVLDQPRQLLNYTAWNS